MAEVENKKIDNENIAGAKASFGTAIDLDDKPKNNAENKDIVNEIITGTISSFITETKPDDKPKDNVENKPNAEEDDGVEPVQVIEDLNISSELAGVIVTIIQLVRSAKVLSNEQGFDFIKQMYELDTGKFLKVSQIQSLFYHKKVKAYDEKILAQVKVRDARLAQRDFAELDRRMAEKNKPNETKK